MNLLRYMWIFACPHLTFDPWFGVANCPPIVLTQTKRAAPCQNPNTVWASGNNGRCVFRGQRYHPTNLFAFCCTCAPAQARHCREERAAGARSAPSEPWGSALCSGHGRRSEPFREAGLGNTWLSHGEENLPHAVSVGELGCLWHG